MTLPEMSDKMYENVPDAANLYRWACSGERAAEVHCDCRADDWVEGDEGAIRCVRCGGYAGEPGTSIHVVPVADDWTPESRDLRYLDERDRRREGSWDD